MYNLIEYSYNYSDTPAQKIKFSMKDFFSKCDQICRKLQIWSHLLKKSLTEDFTFCAVTSGSLWKIKEMKSQLIMMII